MIGLIFVAVVLAAIVYLVVDEFYCNRVFQRYLNVELEYFRKVLIETYDDEDEMIDRFIEFARYEITHQSKLVRMNYVASILDINFSRIDNLDKFNKFLKSSPSLTHNSDYEHVIMTLVKEYESFKDSII